jgi:hypothetical protein
MSKILRPKKLYGLDGKFGVSKTVFWDDYVWREGGEEFIPGTKVPRLRLAKLNKRAVGAFEDEADRLIEALRAERDATA